MTYRSSSITPTAGPGDVNIPVPTGAAAGDIAVAVIYDEGTATITPPTGFTLKVDLSNTAASRGRCAVYWKRLTAADTGDYTFTGGGTWRAGLCALFSGRIASGDPFTAVSTLETTTATTSAVLPSLTAANGDDLLAVLESFDWAATWTPPGTMTERIDTDPWELATQEAVASGATGTRTFTLSLSSQVKGILGAIAVASSGSAADTGPLALSGQTPTASGSGDAIVTTDVSAVVLSGQDAPLAGSGSIAVGVDTAILALAGVTSDLTNAGGPVSVTVDTAALSLTGQDAANSGSGAAAIAADTGTLLLAGQTSSAGGSGAASTSADVAALVLAGQDSAASGSGSASTATDPAVLTLTGITPPFSSAGGPISVTVDPAALTLTGQGVTAAGSGVSSMAVDAGLLVLVGQTPGTTANVSVAVDTATLALAGITAAAVGTGAAQVIADMAGLTLLPPTPTAGGSGAGAMAASPALLQLAGVQALLFSGDVPTPVAPPERTLTVSAETRTLVVPAESRRLTIAAEFRIVIAEPEE